MGPGVGDFGALPFIFGTLATSFLALVMAVPLALGVAVFLTELCPAEAARADLVPYRAAGGDSKRGLWLWAVFVLVPLMRDQLGAVPVQVSGLDQASSKGTTSASGF